MSNEEIVLLVKDVIPKLKTFLAFYDVEHITAEMVSWKTNSLVEDQNKLIQRNEELHAENERILKNNLWLIEEGKKEKQNLVDEGRQMLVDAAKDRKQAKDILLEAEEKKFIKGQKAA